MNGIIGRKIGMTRVFDSRGRNLPVTIIEAGPCIVTQIKNVNTDGYHAIQLGFEDKEEKNTKKPELGHFVRSGTKPKRILREFKLSDDSDSFKIGDAVKVDIFEEGNIVQVTGWSKGKGFQGTVKKYGFAGGPKTHGQSNRLRAPGSIGQSSSPSRVFKGIKMAGRTGNARITNKNKRIIKIDTDKNIIMVAGSVPGPNMGLILIKG